MLCADGPLCQSLAQLLSNSSLRHRLGFYDALNSCAEFLHVKPGKGAAFVRTKLKNYLTGNTVERTFRAGETVCCFT